MKSIVQEIAAWIVIVVTIAGAGYYGLRFIKAEAYEQTYRDGYHNGYMDKTEHRDYSPTREM